MVCKLVRGTLVLEGSSPVQPLADLVVRLGALRGSRFSLLGETRTAQDGTFSFDLDALPSAAAGAAMLEVRVYEDGERLTAHGDVRWRRAVDPGPLVICVELSATCAVPPEPFPPDFPGNNNVWGRVRHHDGTPLSGVIVEVREVTNAGEPLLVGVNTDAEGWYAATITPPKDIVVRVLEPAQPPAQPRLLGSSRAQFSPSFPLRIDVDVCDDKYRRATEWSRLSDALTPLLGATAPQDVDTRLVAVLSGRSGWDVERITLWVLAQKLGQSIPADAESLYGLLRLGFPRTQEGLLSRPRSTVGPALSRAAARYLIAGDKAVPPDLDTFLAALSAGLKSAYHGPRKDTLGEILRASGVLSGTQITELIGLYADHTGSEAEFWDLVFTPPSSGLPSFDAVSKAEAQRLVTLGTLALSFAPAVSSILVTIGSGPASDVAGIDAAGWATIVSPARLATLPVGLPGTNDAEQRDALAAYLAEHAERMFPAATAREGLIAALGPGHALQPAKTFLTVNQAFDLATSRVDDAAFTGTDAEKAATKKAQRLYRVAPEVGRASVIAALGDAGFDSGWSIARRTRARFVAEQAGTLGTETAEIVARKATALQAITTTFLLQAHPTNSRAEYAFLPNVAFDTGDVPDWETLFGNTDACACAWCRSVHGPAAYFVDLLRWLADRPASAGTGPTLYDELISRRPDLAEIELSCENAERALPYIDLVLEALESAVANTTSPGEVDTDAAHASVVTTPDMLAAPQYRNDDAYTTLATATKAVGLPFHRPLAEARVFLAHLGIPRSDLLRAWEDTLGITGSSDIATEQLGLFAARLTTITDAAGSGAELSYWPVAALTELGSVTTLRRVGEVTWPEILDLLHTRYVNPRTWDSVNSEWDRVLEVTATDWCDLDTYTVQLVGGGSPAEADWTRLRQFLRLWRAIGGTALDLDKVLSALGVDDLNADAWLEDLARLHRLSALTGLSLLELAQVGASQIDTFEDRDSREEPVPSLYDRVFLSPAVVVESDPEYATFQLNDQRSALATTGETLADHAAAVAAALGWTRDELDVALTEAALTDLTLANLTTLYAWSVVGRATGLRPEDLFSLVDLTGLSPLSSTADLADLVETATELRAAGWTVDELRYLALHERAERVGATDDFVQLALGRLRDALRAAFEALGEGSTEASVREKALQVLAEQLGADKDALDGLRSLTWSGLPALATGTAFTLAEDATVTPSSGAVDLPAGALCTIPAGTALTRNGTAETLAIDTVAALDAATTGTVSTITASQGAGWTLAATGEATFSTDTGFAVATANVAGTTALTTPDGDALVLTSPTDIAPLDEVTPASAVTGTLTFASDPPSPDLLRRFLRDEFLAGETTTDTPYDDITSVSTVYADDITVFRALHKATLLLSHLDLDEEERAFWFDATNTSAWSIAAIDGLAGDGAASFDFAEMKALIELFAQRRRIPGSSPSFVALLEASGTAADFSAALSERTDWNEADLAALAAQAGADPSSVTGLETLLDRMAIVRRVGADAATVTTWAVAPGDVDAAASAQVVAAARARHASADAWGAVARPGRDVLRKAQRDALVAWLLAEVGSDDIEDADDLYQHYLIDVSMNPEMLTSRIVQAAATVQLYVHRLMLGLERDGSGAMIFEPNAEDREQWEWMRSFRVWEAARKVFLYPENWIEPELRDDKSPFFVELERELAQGDVTDERVDQALLDYLDRLREVSNLQVVAYTWQKEALADKGGEDIDVLHVFARTRSEPPSYWYRRYEDQERWTPWEKVECGVEGKHLVPVVYERRLLLFWLELAEGSVEDTDGTRWEIRLAWSEYRDGRWSPKRTPAEPLLDHYSSGGSLMDKATLSVWPQRGASGLAFRVGFDFAYDGGAAWVVFGRYELNPCTLELELVQDPELSNPLRAGAIDTYWSVPGHHTGDGDDEWETRLLVYDGEVDTDGAISGTADEVLLLDKAPSLTVVTPADAYDFVSQAPFFVQSSTRCWFVVPGEPTPEPDAAVGALGTLRESTTVLQDNPPSPNDPALVADWASYLPTTRYTDQTIATEALTATDLALVQAFDPSTFNLGAGGYRFFVFYHPHVCTFTEAVRRDGVFALLDPDPDGPEASLSTGSLRRQQLTGAFDFAAELDPDPDNVDPRYPVEDVDFSEAGAYSGYNWELFFHVPLYVASRLMDTGRHEDAMRMLHAIFDPRVGDADLPTGADASARWWKVAPFMEPVSTPVTDWIAFTGASGDADAALDFARQVDEWRDDPFNPHLLARLRPGTYQKVTVMRYVENLIAWGDALFLRDTLESLNEATQLYVLARQILGERPEILEPRDKPVAKTYAELLADGSFDAFGNVVLENAWTAEVPSTGSGSGATALTASTTLTTYFCVPHNAKLLSYWDTVEDRLFKIRNGMNIEGVVRTLPLFQPPIDPALLVRAAAAGIDIGTALDDLAVSLPHHRFAVLHGRATAISGSVRALGQALLAALEKKDAEALAMLRQDQELALLDAVGEVRDHQMDEARRSLDALKKSKALVKARKRYFEKLADKGWIGEEIAAAALTATASAAEITAGILRLVQAGTGAAPDAYAGTLSGVKTGGENISRVPAAVAAGFEIGAAGARGAAAYLSTAAVYKRRAQEWKHQSKQAELELAQLDKQIAAAEIRLEIARKERKNHALQVSHAEQVREFLTRKFTNEELYRWMSGQLSALYFQQYQLALATAKKAQACFNHELGRSDAFIQSVYWDSLRKGLLAGERLAADLERMDVAYLEHDRRELELAKQVSLARLDPLALVRLREDGECFFELPEVLFDLDCPGHVNRRLVSVALTAACVGGPHGQVNLRLTLHGSKLRRTASDDLEAESGNTYPSIVTSTAEEDPGVFNTSDGRYLPFERRGAVSSWHLAFCNPTYKQLDWDSLSDVTLHLRYTARDGGETWRAARLAALPGELDALKGGYIGLGSNETSSRYVVALSAKRDDPDAWAQAQEDQADGLTLSLSDRLPYFAVGRLDEVTKVHLLLVGATDPATGDVSASTSSETGLSFTAWPASGSSVAHAETSGTFAALSAWPDELTVDNLSDGTSPIDLSTVDDLLVVVELSVS